MNNRAAAGSPAGSVEELSCYPGAHKRHRVSWLQVPTQEVFTDARQKGEREETLEGCG